jgi:hypothetical protein
MAGLLLLLLCVCACIWRIATHTTQQSFMVCRKKSACLHCLTPWFLLACVQPSR